MSGGPVRKRGVMELDEAVARVVRANELRTEHDRRAHLDELWARKLAAEIAAAIRVTVDQLDRAGRAGTVKMETRPLHGWLRPTGWHVSHGFVAVDGRTWHQAAPNADYRAVSHEEYAYRIIMAASTEELDVAPGDPGFRNVAALRAEACVGACAKLVVDFGIL